MIPFILYIQVPISIEDYLQQPTTPSEELYGHYISNCMTLGRGFMSYGDYCVHSMKSQQEEIDRMKLCDFKIVKIAVTTMEDLKDYVTKFNKPPMWKIINLDKIKEEYGLQV